MHRLSVPRGRDAASRSGQAPEFGGLKYAGELRESGIVENFQNMPPGHTGRIFLEGAIELGPIPTGNVWRIHHVAISGPGGGMAQVFTDAPTLENLFADLPNVSHHGMHLAPPVELRSGQSIIFIIVGICPAPGNEMPHVECAISGQIYLDTIA